jgi:hypothetical protein
MNSSCFGSIGDELKFIEQPQVNTVSLVHITNTLEFNIDNRITELAGIFNSASQEVYSSDHNVVVSY